MAMPLLGLIINPHGPASRFGVGLHDAGRYMVGAMLVVATRTRARRISLHTSLFLMIHDDSQTDVYELPQKRFSISHVQHSI